MMRFKFSFLIVILFYSSFGLRAQTPLAQSFKSEIKLLELEKLGLENVLKKEELNIENKKRQLKSEIKTLSERLILLKTENQGLSSGNLLSLEAKMARDRQQNISTIHKQIMEKLPKKSKNNLAGKSSHQIFKVFMDYHFERSGIFLQKKKYFNHDGSLREAKVLHLSNIAAFSYLDGSLTPMQLLSDGHLKSLKFSQSFNLENFKSSGGAVLLNTFLWDAQNPGFTFEGKNIWQSFLSGGLLMWPILILAILAILISIFRSFRLYNYSTKPENLWLHIEPLISQGNLHSAEKVLGSKSGFLAKILFEVLSKATKSSRNQLEEKASELIIYYKPRLERGLSILGIVAAVAPLLGLLGTVTGMISTFMVINDFGTSDPKLMSGGISTALLTTQFGLAVAVPSLIIGTLLRRWVDHLLADFEIYSLMLINHLDFNEFLNNQNAYSSKTSNRKEIELKRESQHKVSLEGSDV